MWLKPGVRIEKAVLVFKLYLHMFYFVINSLTFSLHAEAVTLIDKGTKEIKLCYWGMSAWMTCTVNWKADFNVSQHIGEAGSWFPLSFRHRDRSHWEGKLNSKGKLNFTCDLSRTSARSSRVADWHGWTSLNSFVIHKNKVFSRRYSQVLNSWHERDSQKNKHSWERIKE